MWLSGLDPYMVPEQSLTGLFGTIWKSLSYLTSVTVKLLEGFFFVISLLIHEIPMDEKDFNFLSWMRGLTLQLHTMGPQLAL